MSVQHLVVSKDDHARGKGYTRQVYIDGGMEGHEALVKPDTDFDDRFVCWSLDWQQFVTVNGWAVIIEEA